MKRIFIITLLLAPLSFASAHGTTNVNTAVLGKSPAESEGVMDQSSATAHTDSLSTLHSHFSFSHQKTTQTSSTPQDRKPPPLPHLFLTAD